MYRSSLIQFLVCAGCGWLCWTVSSLASIKPQPEPYCRMLNLTGSALDPRLPDSFSDTKAHFFQLDKLDSLYHLDTVVIADAQPNLWLPFQGDKMVIPQVLFGDRSLWKKKIDVHGRLEFRGKITVIPPTFSVSDITSPQATTTQSRIYYLRKSSNQECTKHYSCYRVVGQRPVECYSIHDIFGWRYSLEWGH